MRMMVGAHTVRPCTVPGMPKLENEHDGGSIYDHSISAGQMPRHTSLFVHWQSS